MDDGQALLSVELILNVYSASSPISFVSLTGGTVPNKHDLCGGSRDYALESLIWKKKNPNTSDLAKLLKAVVTTNIADLIRKGPRWRYGPNVCIRKDEGQLVVYKSFDYRYDKPKVEADQRRSHILNLENIPGCKVFLEDKDLCVIKYPFLPGKYHHASKVYQIVQVLVQLKGGICFNFRNLVFYLYLSKGLHDENICFGDVRASNIVFGKNKSCFIDFDFAGECGKRVYPDGFVKKIDDGKRHKHARGGEPLQKLHDCFAFAAVMKLHDCDNNDKWDKAIKHLEEQDVDECLKLLDEISHMDLSYTNY